jgi:hypothetical protein
MVEENKESAGGGDEDEAVRVSWVGSSFWIRVFFDGGSRVSGSESLRVRSIGFSVDNPELDAFGVTAGFVLLDCEK